MALIIAVATLLFLFLNPDYRVGVLGGAIWPDSALAALIYFAVHGRKTPVYSPEEEFAVRADAGEEAIPEAAAGEGRHRRKGGRGADFATVKRGGGPSA